MNVLIMRPSPEGEELVNSLRIHGKSACHLPLIKFDVGNDLFCLNQRLNKLRKNDLLFVVSKHAIYYAHHWLTKQRIDWPSQLKYYAIGSNTGIKVNKLINLPVLHPYGRGSSEDLLSLLNLPQLKGKQALILRGNNGRTILEQTLTRHGIFTSCCECYQRVPIHYNGEEQIHRMNMLTIDTLVISSVEMLQRFYTLIPKRYHRVWLFRCCVVVISDRLAKVVREWGWKNIIVANAADNDALIRVLL